MIASAGGAAAGGGRYLHGGVEVFEIVLEIVTLIVLYLVGMPVVRLLTGGRLRVTEAEPDAQGRRQRRWYSLTFTRDGVRCVDPEVVALIGLVFFVGVAGATVAGWALWISRTSGS